MQSHFWNMLASLKNGQITKRSFVYQRRKKLCESFLKALWNEGFILGYSLENSRNLKILLKYNNGHPAIGKINFISTPSNRIYCSAREIWKINSSESLILFSTSQGLKSLTQCKKLRIGGEPLAEIK